MTPWPKRKDLRRAGPPVEFTMTQRLASERQSDVANVIEMPSPLQERKLDDLNPESRALLMKMYDSLRKEIEGLILESSKLGTYGVIGTGALWAFVISNKAQIQPRFLLFIPSALAALFFFRADAVRRHIHIVSDHIARIERIFDLKEFGWETLWQGKRKGRIEGNLGLWQYIYWTFILLINILMAVYFYR
jgi:hypothetical protein